MIDKFSYFEIAIPKDKELAEKMTGVEIRNGGKLLFRGGVWDAGDFYWLYNEDGTLDSLGFSVHTFVDSFYKTIH